METNNFIKSIDKDCAVTSSKLRIERTSQEISKSSNFIWGL